MIFTGKENNKNPDLFLQKGTGIPKLIFLNITVQEKQQCLKLRMQFFIRTSSFFFLYFWDHYQ